MKSNWIKKPLSKVVMFKNGKKRPKDFGNIPVYGGNGILGYADNSNYENCIIIGRVGAYCGSVCYENNKCWVSDNAIAAQPIGENNIIFIYYLLKNLQLNNRHIGTSQPLLTQEILNRIECAIPPVEEQNRIASIINLIDEKIQNNIQINDNLLQQAQAIFTNEFASLQTIPNGWKEGSLLDIADYLNGLAMQKFRPKENEESLPVLKIKELRQGFCDTSSDLCSQSINPEYVIHDGDVVFSWSGSLLVDFWCGGDCGLNQHLFKVSSKKYDKWFYFAWTKHHLQKFIAIASGMATTMGHIKREELEKAKVLIPSPSDYQRIGNILKPLYELVISNRIENKKLSELRDSLLPKLMSGELDVSDIEI